MNVGEAGGVGEGLGEVEWREGKLQSYGCNICEKNKRKT